MRGRKRTPEQLGCGGLRPSKELAAAVGMVRLRGVGTGVWLGFGDRPNRPTCLFASETMRFLCPVLQAALVWPRMIRLWPVDMCG